MNKLYKNLIEIGAGDEFSSQGLKLVDISEKVTLFEPNLILSQSLEQYCKKYDNVKVEKVAISKNSNLYHLGYASFIENAFSFLGSMIEHEGFPYLEILKRKVETKLVSEIDDGSIDFLILTINGAEVSILSEIISRPKVIITKSYCHTHVQVNNFNLLIQWMTKNNYNGKLIETNQYKTYFHISWENKII